MTRRYRDNRTSGVTASRAEARANRKLQLVISNSHPGEQGKTLMQRSEELLDVVMTTRHEKAKEHTDNEPEDGWSADDQEEYVDWMLVNEGEIRGMLKQLALWRSTSMKVELQRAKVRVEFKGKQR